MDVQVTIFDLKGNHLGIKASTLDLRQPPPGFHWFPKFMLCPGVTTPRFIETGFGMGRPPKHSGRATQQQFMFFLFVLFFSQTFEGRFSLLQRCNQELSQTIRFKEKKLETRDCWNMIGLTSWKQVISVKFTPYQVWRGMCMHPGSRLTTRQFIANSLLLCLFKTLFYSGFTGWGTPFYTQIYGALGGHPSAFHIGKPIL